MIELYAARFLALTDLNVKTMSTDAILMTHEKSSIHGSVRQPVCHVILYPCKHVDLGSIAIVFR